MKTRTVLVMGVLSLTFVIGVLFLTQMSTVNTQPVSAEVTIPPGAFTAPSGWQEGYIFDDKYFSPNKITIRSGQAVRWTNNDSSRHTVSSHSLPPGAEKFDSGPLDPGKPFVLVFKVPGEYEYHCNLHPFAAGRIQVLP